MTERAERNIYSACEERHKCDRNPRGLESALNTSSPSFFGSEIEIKQEGGCIGDLLVLTASQTEDPLVDSEQITGNYQWSNGTTTTNGSVYQQLLANSSPISIQLSARQTKTLVDRVLDLGTWTGNTTSLSGSFGPSFATFATSCAVPNIQYDVNPGSPIDVELKKIDGCLIRRRECECVLIRERACVHVRVCVSACVCECVCV